MPIAPPAPAIDDFKAAQPDIIAGEAVLHERAVARLPAPTAADTERRSEHRRRCDVNSAREHEEGERAFHLEWETINADANREREVRSELASVTDPRPEVARLDAERQAARVAHESAADLDRASGRALRDYASNATREALRAADEAYLSALEAARLNPYFLLGAVEERAAAAAAEGSKRADAARARGKVAEEELVRVKKEIGFGPADLPAVWVRIEKLEAAKRALEAVVARIELALDDQATADAEAAKVEQAAVRRAEGCAAERAACAAADRRAAELRAELDSIGDIDARRKSAQEKRLRARSDGQRGLLGRFAARVVRGG